MKSCLKTALQHVRNAMIANKHGAPVAPALEAAEEALLRLLFSEETVIEYLQSSGAQVYREAPAVAATNTPVNLDTCDYCDRGFRRVEGVHIGSRRLGMIPNEPCGRVRAICTDVTDGWKPWEARVDGETLRKPHGEPRRFSSAHAAYAAACKAAPKKWHP